MSAKFVFDVDGVLCNRGQKMDTEFQHWLEDFLQDKDYYLVTGSHRQKTCDQIDQQLTHGAKIGFHCLGNSIWTKSGVEVAINQPHFTDKDLEHLKGFHQSSLFNKKQSWENVLERRNGSYNYSLCARNATSKERQAYMLHDSMYKERENFVIQLNNEYPRFDCYLGGDCSIDIVLRGANKGQITDWLDLHGNDDTIYFFGDRCNEYGIDKPLADKMMAWPQCVVFEVADGYTETWRILKSL